MSFRNYFIYCVVSAAAHCSSMWFFSLVLLYRGSLLCAHPKLAKFATERRRLRTKETKRRKKTEKPEKITRNEKKSREIIYKIDMFHHVPWILMHLVSSRMRITHISLFRRRLLSTLCDEIFSQLFVLRSSSHSPILLQTVNLFFWSTLRLAVFFLSDHFSI